MTHSYTSSGPAVTTHEASGAAKPADLSAPPTSLPRRCKPAAKRAGESYPPRPRREDRRVVPGSGAGGPLLSARSSPLAPAGCCLSRGARSIEPPKTAAGGNRRKVARFKGRRGKESGSLGPGGGAGKGAAPPGVPGVRRRVRCPPRPGSDPRRKRLAPPEPRRSSSRSAAGARCVVAAAAPEFAEEGAMRREPLGLPVPGPAKWERGRAPTFPAGRTPAARPLRASRTGKSPRRGPGESGGWLQDKVGGSSSTAKKTLPSRPGLFGKLQGRK
ncbi:hypothetical protein J1605_000286 [Eschrichtius robustus]|uniref:Uncharacterized protein n=1 Tax=Eschrichtius robustus TaxID=9764 RepID=A0AB34HNQ6_ESCRO|nr:hypothetical protein J1605_000286 [Eschrichtius robustus]